MSTRVLGKGYLMRSIISVLATVLAFLFVAPLTHAKGKEKCLAAKTNGAGKEVEGGIFWCHQQVRQDFDQDRHLGDVPLLCDHSGSRRFCIR